MPSDHGQVLTGLDVLQREGHPLLMDRRIGLVTNHTAIDRNYRHIIHILQEDDRYNLVALFAPEHGLDGAAQAGAPISNSIHKPSGIPIVSLYSGNTATEQGSIHAIDVLVYDIQDVGARHYTYLSTLVQVMRWCADIDIPLVVLDRPNPVSGLISDGRVLAPEYHSFVGAVEIPTRHPFTIGELAYLIAMNEHLPTPEVIWCQGWTREQWWDDTGLPFVMPSPNLPTLDSLTVYTATCILEATNVSEGRGTTRPFEIIGAPWVNAEALADDLNGRMLPGVHFRPERFRPVFSKHTNDLCSGVQLHIIARNEFLPAYTGMHILHSLLHQPGSAFTWLHDPQFEMSHPKLYGGPELPDLLASGATPDEIAATWAPLIADHATKWVQVQRYPTNGSS